MLRHSWLYSFKAALTLQWGVNFLGIECEACMVRVPSPSWGRGLVATLTRVETAGGDKQTDSIQSSEADGTEVGEGLTWDEGEGRAPGFDLEAKWVGGEEIGIQDEEWRRWLLGTWWMT